MRIRCRWRYVGRHWTRWEVVEVGRKFNVAVFVGGPLDGVTWPCVVKVDQVAVRSVDGRYHLYECDRETEYGDGTFEYRLTPTLDQGEFMEEFNHGFRHVGDGE